MNVHHTAKHDCSGQVHFSSTPNFGKPHITGVIEGIVGVLTPLQVTLGPEDDVQDSLGFQARTGQV